MEVAKLREELTQCWVAEALANVSERAVAQCQVNSKFVVSVGNSDIARQGAAVSTLMNAFLRRNGLVPANFSSACNAHVESADELQHLVTEQTVADAAANSNGLLFMIYAPCAEDAAAQQLRDIVEAATKLRVGRQHVVLLVLQNVSGLLGLQTSVARSSSNYHLQYLENDAGGISDWRIKAKFVADPLGRLREQCGWRFVMEIVQWVPGVTGKKNDKEPSAGTGQVVMFTSINQLPFQLLLLVLRWSHFHPQIAHACSRKLRRQMQLIPETRVRRELEALQKREAQLWSGMYPITNMPDIPAQLTQEHPTSSLFDRSSHFSPAPSKLCRLSKCRLWDTQKQFYKEQGIRAWSSGSIPFGVSSSSFLAAAYARTAVEFLLSTAACIVPSHDRGSPNCYVWEAASGSCKFLHSFMLHFTDLVKAEDEFQKRGLVPLVVATDLSDQVLHSRRQMECFRPFIEAGQLDFALFDTYDFVHGNPQASRKKKTLELMHSQREWHVGSDGPFVLIGNYFLDSLRADVFAVASRQKITPMTTRSNPCRDSDNSSEYDVVVQEALLAEDTSSIADMHIILRAIEDPKTLAVYEDSQLNSALLQVLDNFKSRIHAPTSAAETGATESTGIILFPVEALLFFLALIGRDEADIAQQQAFPVAIMAGDAGFTFRDAISSAFLTSTSRDDNEKSKTTSLELPQLSPHPDCFCLPVDFEIFKMFFQNLDCSSNDISVCSQVVSAPASDTFDVFFATIEPQSNPEAKRNITSTAVTQGLHSSFKQEFAHFTPGDCDLLWGMMSFDDGARSFSSDTLLALLEQTGWDFDLFAVLHWELLRRWRRKTTPTGAGSDTYKTRLIQAGIKCWRTFYTMEQQSEIDAATRGIRLQLARWFYELDAYDCVLDVLAPWLEEMNHQNSGAKDVGILYLLGLTSVALHEYWAALTYFRHCTRLTPTKLKFQRQITRTLITLQTIRSASNSSNESDAGE